MTKIKDGFKYVWGLAVEGYEVTTDKIAKYPRVAFWIMTALAIWSALEAMR